MEAGSSGYASFLSWHLVFTKPSSERLAKVNLERQGYTVYFPQLAHRVLKRGRWRDTISGLFPRYLFVQLNAALQSLSPMQSTLGVAQVVRFGTEFARVPEDVVNGLISCEDAEGLHRLINPVFETGCPVRVIEGPFSGIEGVFEREEANDRIVVLLNLLGREARIKLPSANVMPARSNVYHV